MAEKRSASRGSFSVELSVRPSALASVALWIPAVLRCRPLSSSLHRADGGMALEMAASLMRTSTIRKALLGLGEADQHRQQKLHIGHAADVDIDDRQLEAQGLQPAAVVVEAG